LFFFDLCIQVYVGERSFLFLVSVRGKKEKRLSLEGVFVRSFFVEIEVVFVRRIFDQGGSLSFREGGPFSERRKFFQ